MDLQQQISLSENGNQNQDTSMKISITLINYKGFWGFGVLGFWGFGGPFDKNLRMGFSTRRREFVHPRLGKK